MGGGAAGGVGDFVVWWVGVPGVTVGLVNDSRERNKGGDPGLR
jgi:hypothetical protein